MIEADPATSLSHLQVVGIGASAGGLEAIARLLAALPDDTGLAFVVVQHLSADHASALPEILGRATRIPVMEIRGEVQLEADRIYVIPPGHGLTIKDRVLGLVPRPAGLHHPIDQFFRSLAADQQQQAIGVVLSGTGNDGTLGLEAIKAGGGLTFAQDATAQYEGMPQSAILAGTVDFVLPAEAIAAELARLARHPLQVHEVAESDRSPEFSVIVQQLHAVSGVDFSSYRFSTLSRRIGRRMLLHHLDDLGAYASYLKDTPGEVSALHRDILISVTSFFRDPEAFDVLKARVFPHILAGKSAREPLRVWTLGCSTGQEAYSIAMAIAEFTESEHRPVPLQVFATDVSEASITSARAGIYDTHIADEMSPERLQRFFTPVDGRYRISKAIRDACIFSRHDATADPPFSRVDLISCRNLLIYLEPPLQQKVLGSLHYALKPAGFLWLGATETIGAQRRLFDVVDSTHRIYTRTPGATPPAVGPAPRLGGRFAYSVPTTRGGGPVDLPKEADRVLSTRYGPPAVVVSEELDILQYRGDTGAYLAPSPGKASLNLLRMLREGLLVDVRRTILRASIEHTAVRQEGCRVRSGDTFRPVTVEVIPLKEPGTGDEGFLVLFEDAAGGPDAAASPPLPDDAAAREPGELARMEQELLATRDYLQSVIEQQEASNEELQSANEEIQSSNEELQSINEELETSKEEIQSSNEELATVNDELNQRNAELNRLGDDLTNLIHSVHIPIVILGPDLRIRRFTPAAESLFNLIPSDLGRPLRDIAIRLHPLAELDRLLAEVLNTMTTVEREVQDETGCWHLLRLRPYRTLDNRINGVVLLLQDIDAMKAALAYTKSIVETVREPLLVLDEELRVRTASAAWYRCFQTTPAATIGRLVFELGEHEWDIPALRALLVEVLPRDNEFSDFEVTVAVQPGLTRTMLLNARRLRQAGGTSPAILLAFEDVTESRSAERRLRHLAGELQQADRHKDEFLAMLAHELRNPLAPIRNSIAILQAGRDRTQVSIPLATLDRQVDVLVRLVDDLLDAGRISHGKIQLRRERVLLQTLIENAVEVVQPVCTAREQRVMTIPSPDPIHVDADPARIIQVIGNLLHNACKFTSLGGHITISSEREGAMALVRVMDDGIGIEREQQEHVFDLFMQADASVARSSGGLGIGLALVKQLVEQHGGRVAVVSAGVGRGSTFEIRLPAEDVAPALADTVPREQPGERGATRRVLVVDDNKDAADSLAALLQLKGHDVRTVYDGLAALDLAATFQPDVVLLDIGLPELSGYEVASRLRASAGGSLLRIIALTGWGDDRARAASLKAGIDHHLLKPVTLDQLQPLLQS